MYIFLFVVPGILLILLKGYIRKGPAELFIYIIGLSLSFFVVMLWPAKILHVPLQVFTWIILISSFLILLLNHKNIQLKEFLIDKKEGFVILILFLALLLRLVPLFLQLAPAGAEMSMQVYIAKTIFDNDGMPSFIAYPTGLPTISAITSMYSEMAVYRSSFFVSCLAHAFVIFGLYVLLLRFFDKNIAIFASIAASFLSISPQSLMSSGDNAIVLAIFFFLVFVSLSVESYRDFSRSKSILALMAFIAAFVTQPFLLFNTAILIIPVAFVIAILIKKFMKKMARFSPVLVVIGILFYSTFYLYDSVLMCPVIQADIDAFKWVDRTISEKAVFINNYGDAGLWIPAITGRSITNPYGQLFPAYKPKVGKLKPNYIYIGAKVVYGIEFKREYLESHPWKYKRVYSKGGAQVWKIL